MFLQLQLRGCTNTFMYQLLLEGGYKPLANFIIPFHYQTTLNLVSILIFKIQSSIFHDILDTLCCTPTLTSLNVSLQHCYTSNYLHVKLHWTHFVVIDHHILFNESYHSTIQLLVYIYTFSRVFSCKVASF